MWKDKKRYFVLAGLVVLLVVTGYVNYRLNNPDGLEANAQAAESKKAFVVAPDSQAEAASQTSVSGANFFVEFRASRDMQRSEELKVLDSMIADPNSDEETLKEAQSAKLNIVDCMEKEMTVEGLLKAKGFKDAVVTLHRGSVYVVLDTPALSNESVAQVLDIVQQETGEKPEAIKVLPRVQ